METIGNKCNCYEEEDFPQYISKVPRNLKTHRFDCYVQRPKFPLMGEQDVETTSSSSSSSSSSESEEEMNIYPKMKRVLKNKKFLPRLPFEQTKMDTETTLPEWTTVVDLEGCFPQEVFAKLNTKNRFLLIKVKSCGGQTTFPFHVRKEQQEEMFQQTGKVVRIVPLPENIHFQKLRVNIFPTGEVIVKAPYIETPEIIMRQKQILRSLPLWVPIPVIRKDTNKLNKLQGFSNFAYYPGQQYYYYPRDNYYYYPGQKYYYYPGQKYFYYPSQQYTTIQGQEECFGRRHGQYRTMNKLTNVFRPEVIRDEVTGKLATLLKVNIMGFLPEDVRVRVDETKNVLIVEATCKRNFTQMEFNKKELLQQGLPVKYLRREFILPQGVNVNYISYCVMEKGLLVIKVPLMNTTTNTTEQLFPTGYRHNIRQHTGIENVDDMFCDIYRKWEKPLLA